jgi:lambda family phage portal protein
LSLRRTIGRTLRRAADRFSGDGNGRPSSRWPAWAASTAPAREQLASRWRNSARASFLISGSPTASAISDTWATSLIGTGPTPASGHHDESMRRALENAFTAWSELVDLEELHDLGGHLCAGVRSLVSSGELLDHMVTTRHGELRLHLLNPEQLDPALTREIENLQRIISGVEFDLGGRVTGYHVFPRQADLIVASQPWAPTRLPREDVCHVFEVRTPGQVRGSSWLSSVLTTILQIDQLQDALLARANTASLFGALITDPSGTSGLGGGSSDPQELSLEPGVIRLLPPDCTVSFPTVPDADGTSELLKHMLRQVAVGAGGLCYELMTGDMGEATYSSTKVSIEAFKRRCKTIRETLLIARLLRPIWRRWVTLEILSGRMYAPDFERDPSPFFAVDFLFDDFASLDPYREAQADVALINAGVRSRREVIAARGRDPDDVDSEIESDTFVPRTAMPPGNPQLENSNASFSATLLRCRAYSSVVSSASAAISSSSATLLLAAGSHTGAFSQICTSLAPALSVPSHSLTSPFSGKPGNSTTLTLAATPSKFRATSSACRRPGLSLSGKTRTCLSRKYSLSSGAHGVAAPPLALVATKPSLASMSALPSPSTM